MAKNTSGNTVVSIELTEFTIYYTVEDFKKHRTLDVIPRAYNLDCGEFEKSLSQYRMDHFKSDYDQISQWLLNN